MEKETKTNLKKMLLFVFGFVLLFLGNILMDKGFFIMILIDLSIYYGLKLMHKQW